MTKKIKLFTKKSLSLILALAVLLTSVVSTISVFAAASPYKVSFRAPAIPMDAMTVLNLADIEVQLEENGAYYGGDELIWFSAVTDTSKFVINESAGTITAYQRGTYPLTAQSTDGKTKTVYLSVKGKDETAFPIYEITFDDYSSISNENYASSDYTFSTAYPTGWTAQVFSNLYQAQPSLITLSGVSPYNAHYVSESNSKQQYGVNTVGPGIVPFNNKEAYWLAPGFFTLTDSAVSAFYDFTVNSTFVGFDTKGEGTRYNFGTALFGRVGTTNGLITRPIDSTNPLTLIYAYKGADTDISDVNIVDYSANGKNDGGMWDLVADGDIDNDGNNETWDYLADKNASMTNTSAQPTVNMSIKYDGTTATLYSPDDTENQEFSYTVADGKGSVGISQSRVTAGSDSYAGWVNVRTFGVYLNNEPDDKPAAKELDIFEVSYDYPAILMNEDTKVDLASLTVQLTENGDYVLGTQIDWSVDTANSAVILNNTKKFVAVTETGVYPIRATYGENTKVFWLVAKKAEETEFCLVNDDYSAGDSGNWTVFTANADKVFEKTDATVTDYGSYLGMHPGSSINMYLYNQPALLDFASYTVEMDAQTRLGNRTDGDDPFWSYFGLVGRSNADASQHFTLVLRGGYGINFMCDKPAFSLLTASITDAPHYFHYHSFHTLSSATERAKLFPTTDEGGTGEYTDYGDTDRDIYTAKYTGSNVQYSYNNVVIFDSTSETFYDEAVKYELMDTEPSLSNPNVVSTANWWTSNSNNFTTAGGYAGIFAHNYTSIDLYKFKVKLPTTDMAPATNYDASQDKVEMIVDEAFNEKNIILNFGVVSDTHISGGWHQEESSAKWAHTLKTLQQMAKDEGREKLDAILINGDMVDALAGSANVQSIGTYGTKAYQNWLEVKHFADGVTGAYGEGLSSGTQLFYSLGNHDETGMGWSDLSAKGYEKVHTAAYYIAVLCGWQYAYKDTPGTDLTDLNANVDNSYKDFAYTLINYHNDNTTDVSTFEETYGVAFDTAYAAYKEYFGADKDTDATDGLLAGNRHMEINGIHFIAVELSQSDASCAWADAILAEITAEDPTKPVFMMTHVKLQSDTMPGVEGGEHNNLQQVVEKYPQVIIWGGHSHSYLHNDSAIETTNGYTQVESATTEYVSQGDLTYSGATKHSNVATKVQNLIEQHSHMFSNGCYVEVDADYNVRIRRIDLYQSYSTDYKDTSVTFTNGVALYSSEIFTKYGTGVYDAEWSDTYAEIRTPWIISTATRADTDTLKGYTEAKRYNNEAPAFASDKSLTVNGSVGAVKVNFIMNAEDDGMVHNYVVELYKEGSSEILQSYCYTNYFYLYDNSVAGDIPVISESLNFTGLEKGVSYTVKLYAVDDYGVAGEALVKSASTIWGKDYKTLEDGRVAVFLDTKKDPYVYTDEDGSYLTYNSLETALGANPDIIYFINGVDNIWQICSYSKALEVIGINTDRTNTVISLAHLTAGTYPYQNPVFEKDVTFSNLTFDISGIAEGYSQSSNVSYIYYGASNMVLDNVYMIRSTGNEGLRIAAVRNGKVTPGSLTIKGDTGPFSTFGYAGSGYWATGNAYVDGDQNIRIEGGNFEGEVGYYGSPSGSANGAINGNLFLNISGGTFNGKVSLLGNGTAGGSTNAVMKNAVARISGGTFTGSTGLGQTGKHYITGIEAYIIKNSMLTNDTTLSNGKPLTLTSSDTVLIKTDDVDYIGEPTYDDNGVITAFAVVQRPGYDSYVNGVAATEIAVTAGGNYTVTYAENGKAGLLGSAEHADAITSNKAEFVLIDDIAYYEKYSVTLSDANWAINESDDYAYANGILVPLKTGTITVNGTYNGVAFSSDITVKEFDTARNNIVNNAKLSIIEDNGGYVLKVDGQMRYDTLTVNGKSATYLDEVVDGDIKSGTQYVLDITDLTTLSITAKFEYDNADVTGVVYALGATIPTNREDISLRFVNRAPGIKKTADGISLGSTITKGGVEFSAIDIGALVIPEILLDGSELKFKDVDDYKSGATVELANGQSAKNVVISVLNDTTAKYSDYSVLLTDMSTSVEDIKDLQIALVSYIVYADADGNLHIEYTGEISRSYNDVSNAAEADNTELVNLSVETANVPEDKKLIAEFKQAVFTA